MVLVGVDHEGRSSSNTLPLVRVGYDYMVRKVDNLLKWFIRSLPAFTHEYAINLIFLNKSMKLLSFIVNTARIDIHDCWKIEGLNKFVRPFHNCYVIFVLTTA